MSYVQKTDSSGKTYYSFLVYDHEQKKNVRLKKAEIINRFGKDITTVEEAIKFDGLLRAEFDSSRERYKRLMAWTEKYYNFASLLDDYVKKQKRKSPYGWKNNVHYLKYYVLPYFLEISQNNNINGWHLDYPKFRIWLEDEATLIRNKNIKISYCSKNHSIKALNTFMKHLQQDGIIQTYHVCEAFDESKLRERTIDDVITEDESWIIYNQLLDLGHQNEAEYFLLMFWTGMRFNEGLGLSLADIYKGEITRDSFKNLLRRNLIFYTESPNVPNDYLYRYFGFLTLSSQPDNDGSKSIVRNELDHILRKPLKMKKAINEKNNRVIPIVNQELWDALSRRAKDAYQKWKKGELQSNNKSDYLLFENITQTTSTARLKEAFEKANLKYRSWHCCRHSRGTFLHGRTGDKELTMQWLGHSSEKVHNKYLHTYEGLMREIKAKEVEW